MRQRSIGLAHDEYLQVAKSLATHNLHALTATRMERVVDCRLAALIVGSMRRVRTASGKTMLVKNLLHHAVLNGFTARFTTASDMLHELAAQDSDASLARRLRRFTGPQLLAIDEVGYLNYDNRYADLLFEVVTRRYLTSPVLITTNKPFSEWADVFSSATCVVTLVDRLIHRSEIVQLDGESYRLREAKEQAAKRSKARSRRTAKSRAS